jgi:hypothetical protein
VLAEEEGHAFKTAKIKGEAAAVAMNNTPSTI